MEAGLVVWSPDNGYVWHSLGQAPEHLKLTVTTARTHTAVADLAWKNIRPFTASQFTGRKLWGGHVSMAGLATTVNVLLVSRAGHVIPITDRGSVVLLPRVAQQQQTAGRNRGMLTLSRLCSVSCTF